MDKKYVEYLKKKYPIQKWTNNPILRDKSIEVKEIDDNILEVCAALNILMFEYDWVWLAAPQIWVNLRIIAITKRTTSWKEWEVIWDEVMINPKIIQSSNDKCEDEEWCISLPWIEWKVSRNKEIKVSYIDIDGKHIVTKAKWINAAIIQHEMDHLDWELFTDRMSIKDKIKFDKESLFK